MPPTPPHPIPTPGWPRKRRGEEAKLCYQGLLLMENRHGLAVARQTMLASGTAQRKLAFVMATSHPGRHRISLGGDKAYGAAPFVASCRNFRITLGRQCQCCSRMNDHLSSKAPFGRWPSTTAMFVGDLNQ